ncbi:MAG: DUF4350 domain-containing protein [Candidatus Melainabacteria bacterium]|jgi:hypothetical protein|nr:DUF4350 domain-containing protein [Candidatus Melainabacteria bacterium]
MTGAREEKTNKIWWQLFALLAVSGMAVYSGFAFDEQKDKFWPETEIQISVFNRKPSGLSGMQEILGKAGLQCKTWQLPYRNLSDTNGMLVIFQPTESLSELEAKQILDWVSKGNDLVYFDHFSYKLTRRLIDKLDIDTKDGDNLTDAKLPATLPKAPEFEHVDNLLVSAERRLKGGTPLVADKSGAIISVVKHGKGRVLLGTAPSLCCNRQLANADAWPNYQFLCNWLSTARGAVIFDERCHGFSSATNVFHFLLRGPTGLIFWQLMLILAVAVVSTAQRFGAMRQVLVTRKISNLEFIFGLSNAFRRARANTAVLEILGQNFKHRLCKALGISPHETAENIVNAWKTSVHADTANMGDLIGNYERALSKKHLSDSELRTIVGTCDKIAGTLADSKEEKRRSNS